VALRCPGELTKDLTLKAKAKDNNTAYVCMSFVWSFINTYQTYTCYTTENKIMKSQMNEKKKRRCALLYPRFPTIVGAPYAALKLIM